MSTNAEFSSGVAHQVNPGRQNVGSITLGGSLQAGSDRWAALTPHGVLHTTAGGSPENTDAGIEFGQQALGNRDDQDQAGQSMNRMLMQRAAGIGSDDDTA
jgi:hypothetical protein